MYWTNRLRTGTSAAVVSDSFFTSAEFQAINNTLPDNGAFVDYVYNSVLERRRTPVGAPSGSAN